MGRKGGKGEEGEGKSFPSLRVGSPPHLGRKRNVFPFAHGDSSGHIPKEIGKGAFSLTTKAKCIATDF